MKIEVVNILEITPKNRRLKPSSMVIHVYTEQYQLEDMFNQIREDVGIDIMSEWLEDYEIIMK